VSCCGNGTYVHLHRLSWTFTFHWPKRRHAPSGLRGELRFTPVDRTDFDSARPLPQWSLVDDISRRVPCDVAQ
jgi:hypothetical protein